MLPVSFLLLACVGPQTSGQLRSRLWLSENSGYDRLVRPSVAAAAARGDPDPERAPPERVSVQVQFLYLNGVNELEEAVDIMVFARYQWWDPRLQFNGSSTGGCFPDYPVSFPDSVQGELWQPQAFVRNLVGRDDKVELGAVWLSPDGRVRVSSRQRWRLSCPLDMRWLPFDQHTCFILVGTYREGAREVLLEVLDGVGLKIDPLISQYGTTGWKITPEIAAVTEDQAGLGSLDTESSVVILFTLRRTGSGYESLLFFAHVTTMLAWCSFFIDRQAAPARIALCVIAYLSIEQAIRSINFSLPPSATQPWIVTVLRVSALFVLVALVEYGFVNWLGRIEKKSQIAIAHELERRKKLKDEADADGEQCVSSASPASAQDEPAVNAAVIDVEGLGNISATVRTRTATRARAVAKTGMQIASTSVQVARRGVQTPFVVEFASADGFGRFNRLLVYRDGRVKLKGKHLDLLSRWLYPLAYAIYCIVEYARINYED